MIAITVIKKGNVTRFNPFNIFYGKGVSVRWFAPKNNICVKVKEFHIITNQSAN